MYSMLHSLDANSRCGSPALAQRTHHPCWPSKPRSLHRRARHTILTPFSSSFSCRHHPQAARETTLLQRFQEGPTLITISHATTPPLPPSPIDGSVGGRPEESKRGGPSTSVMTRRGNTFQHFIRASRRLDAQRQGPSVASSSWHLYGAQEKGRRMGERTYIRGERGWLYGSGELQKGKKWSREGGS